jgi:inhibitor of cysteine peptidase
MKRQETWLLAAAVVVLLLVSGCSMLRQTTLGESDSGRTVEMRVGRQVTVKLPSNATTGFRWAVASTGPLTQVGESTYDAPQKPGLVGAGGTETFVFKATGSGAGELRLEYRRPWEKGIPAEKTWSVSVSVK